MSMPLIKQLAAIIGSPTDIGLPPVKADDNTIGQIASAVFIIVGALAVMFMLVGAARYITAGGEQPKIAQAKNTILYAIVGIIVSALGFTIVQFILGRLTGNI